MGLLTYDISRLSLERVRNGNSSSDSLLSFDAKVRTLLQLKQERGEFKNFDFIKNLLGKGKLSVLRSNVNLEGIEKTFNDIKEILTFYYPNSWDIIVRPLYDYNSHSETMVFTGKYEVEYFIKFPEINITNRDDDTHTIKDLIVSFSLLKFRGSNISFGYYVKGTRLSRSVKEYEKNYLHSHLPSRGVDMTYYPPLETSDFCMGESNLTDIMDTMSDNDTFDPILFESFLQEIQSLIEWESIEGVPHIRMRVLESSDTSVRISRTSIPPTQMSNFLELADLRRFSNVIELSIQDNKYKIKDTEGFKNEIKNQLREQIKSNYIVKEIDDNPYEYQCYRETSSSYTSVETLMEGIPSYKLFIDGVSHEFNLFEDREEPTQENIDNYFIHPILYKYVKKQLESILYEKAIRLRGIGISNRSNNS